MVMAAQEFWDAQALVAEMPERQREIERVVEDACAWLGDLRGRRVLDLGCGTGLSSLLLAERGAHVVALDGSPKSLERLRQACATRGLTNVEVHVEDALNLERHGPFDAIVGLFILHHIEPFDAFAVRLQASLKPGGRAFFWENAAVPPLVWFRTHLVGRFGIPKYGDADETPLTPGEVDVLRRYFSVEVRIPETLLFRLVSAYLLKRRFGGVCSQLDAWAHATPLRRWSYRQYIMLDKRPADAT